MVDLGSVDRGTSVARKVSVTHAGQSDWKIGDVRSTNNHFEVEVVETGRVSGQVSYDLLVRLKKDAPVGYIKEQLLLVTNDSQAPEIPLEVEGRVVPEVAVTPSPLLLGVLHPGQEVTKQLVIKSKKPFKILSVQCDDPGLTCQPPDDTKAQQIV